MKIKTKGIPAKPVSSVVYDHIHSPTMTGSITRNARSLLYEPFFWPALGFGAGLAPRLPGTVGTLVGMAFYLGLQFLTPIYYIGLLILLFSYGVWLCDRAARVLGVPDHPAIVWDEIVGFLVTMTAAPPGWAWLFSGFLLFRLFDIWKPWPVDWLERRLKGGIGIMADDVLAGIYAWIVIQVTSNLLTG